MGDYHSIRYSELRFKIRLTSDALLPRFKTSAIRGGLGNMLLDEYCIREEFRKENEECEECDFVDECIVQRILYAKMDIAPNFMSSGNSVGYIVECDDTREELEAGDEMSFRLVLFGKNIFYLSQYLSAIYRLGLIGLGKEHARYEVISVCNVYNKPILIDNNIYKDRFEILKVCDYIDYRKKQLGISSECEEGVNKIRIKALSPISIKKDGEFLKEFDVISFMDGLFRRIYIMSCFEGIDSESDYNSCVIYPQTTNIESRYTEIPRYSGRKNQKIFLKGVYGFFEFDLSAINNDLPNERVKSDLLDTLLAGELLHIGSNTSFGFGKYKVEMIKE